MQPSSEERRQIVLIFVGVGVFAAIIWTLGMATTSDLPIWECIVGGVVFGTLFAPTLHFGFRRMGMYAPRGKDRHSCDVCGQALPLIRRPRNVRQFMLGGWTCQNCGAELDRHDRPLQT